MAKYRKRPVVIEAIECFPAEAQVWPDWMIDAFKAKILRADPGTRSIYIATPEGVMRALQGDMIIRGIAGEIYPCKPGIFADTYEPADTPAAVVAALADAVLYGKGTLRVDHVSAEEGFAVNGLRDSDFEMGEAVGVHGPSSPYMNATIAENDPRHPAPRYVRFEQALTDIISGCSMENGSDTPDFIMAEMLTNNLRAFDALMQRRDGWYGASHRRLKGRIEELEIDLEATRGKYLQMEAHAKGLEAQLEAEGEHTAAANANIDRLNTEIERITRRQQGELMGKG